MGSMNFKRGWFFWVALIFIAIAWFGAFEGEIAPAAIFTGGTVIALYVLFIILAKFFS